MSAQTHASDPIIPRPERTVGALRVALAQVAPYRIAEFEALKDEAFDLAAAQGSVAPVRMFLLAWSRDIEIARQPATAARYRDAVHAAQVLDKADPGWLAAMDDVSRILDEAMRAVRD
ncbi:hypothetical protein [Yinghuangia seranimata]|uniref:hypothetical protein n=1 Tax=Yinghuangia seranimata TaxID=408067 RepID=UPI00248CF952|nr:hypothetical protein [Yinghuangia seranimata]MDI2124585.1 hypothetical protein [Yinghuangia seranimata]